MLNQIDARGLSCPQPVILAKKALDSINAGQVLTIVDNETARDNIVLMAQDANCDVNVEQKDNEYHIRITKKEFKKFSEDIPCGRIIIMVSADSIGRGSEELGKILVKSFFYTLLENDEKPTAIIFVNSGINLTCEGSEVLEHLMALEKQGVELLSCGTCLDYYQKKERLCVGQITNMYTIVEKMSKADKVINI